MAKSLKMAKAKVQAPKPKAIKSKGIKPKALKAKTVKPPAAKPKAAKSLKPLKAKLIHRVAASLAPRGGYLPDATVLDRLHAVVLNRRTADPVLSHSARLLARGRAKVAQKFGEEAVEALIEGVNGDKIALVAESADVLYHLLLMWAACDVRPADVWAELERREGVSGIIEKASRPLPRDVVTRKIP
jgi:phosphoribosyl-ATP pyrophosphohydrolase